jgi:hypothetical protein
LSQAWEIGRHIHAGKQRGALHARVPGGRQDG